MPRQTLAEALLSMQQAIENCERSGNAEWLSKHRACLVALESMLPSGSGIDSGTKIHWIIVGADERIILTCSFHHMDEHGGYDGWTDHKITIRPSFSGLHVRVVGGHNRNQINEYLRDVYHDALSVDVVNDAVDGWRFVHD